MKARIFLLSLCVSVFSIVSGQETAENKSQEMQEVKSNFVIDLGLLMGGGSLIGVDLEYVIPTTRFGLQVGVGIGSYGGGINYHLKNNPRSSFLSFQYWQQGFGENHYASYIGPMFVYRAKKWFQAGMGIGNIIEKGPRWATVNKSEQARKVNVALLYNVGIYF